MALMVMATWTVVRVLGVRLLEEGLNARAQLATNWPECASCGQRVHSKGFVERVLRTLFGKIRWRRRVGRCPNGCAGSQVAPLDQALGLEAHQRTGTEVQWMGCLLAVLMPYETAGVVLGQLTGVVLAPGTLWRWVQQVGQRAMV